MDNVSVTVPRGKIVGIVGESGCGKSMTAMSILRLIRKPGKIESGEILFCGEDLLKKTEKEMRKIRGDRISMIFQEPMTSLNPLYTIGHQVMEALFLHEKIDKASAKERAIRILQEVGIPEADARLRAYPHQLSGGLRQRVMIGMAMICKPDLLIADEPTTALDVTIEAQILALMKDMSREFNTTFIFSTHDAKIVNMTDHRIKILDGNVVEDTKVNG